MKSGYTLMELVLAVAILTVTLLLGFSLMQGVVRQRDELVCSANLRQVYTLVQAYVADHDGRLPAIVSNAYGDNSLHWRRAILPYMGLRTGGKGIEADVFRTGLICPAVNRGERAVPAYGKLCNFGLNEQMGDAMAPLERGIPMAKIRNPARFFFATESVLSEDGLPREAIKPKDFNTFATRWGCHRNGEYQNVMFADGHIEFFKNVRRLIMDPYAVGKSADVWTP